MILSDACVFLCIFLLFLMISHMIKHSPISNISLLNPLFYLNVRRGFAATSYETQIANILRSAPDLRNPTEVQVEDRSGGCGANFYIFVESAAFKGIPRIKQHRLVQDILKDEIKKWHAVSIETRSSNS
jgi:stress-induced morphogen